MEYIPLKRLRLNPDNPRVIRDEKYKTLLRSLAEFPQMLSVRGLAVKGDPKAEGELMTLGGNQRLRGIRDFVKMPEHEIREMVGENTDNLAIWQDVRERKAVPASWVVDASFFSEEEMRRFIVADNVEFGEHDFEALANEYDKEELDDWGVFVQGFEEEKKELYTGKIESPIYEPKKEKPQIDELVDGGKVNELIAEIQEANVSDDVKRFLTLAAYRHSVFNYENIAEFYAHSEKDVQELMEKSALVIIDFNKAIEQGYVDLVQGLNSVFKDDYAE